MVKVQVLKTPAFRNVSFTRNDMRKIAAKAISSIQERTQHARDVNDRRMKPLSPQYAAAKRKLGQPAVRNMMFSGSMLGSLTLVELNENKVVIGFTRQAELAKAMANQQRQPWFGLSNRDEEKVVHTANEILRKKTRE